MRYRFLLFSCCLMLAQALGAHDRFPGGGPEIKLAKNEVTIAPENYRHFLGMQAPDSAVAYLIRSVKYEPWNTPNRAFIEKQVAENNVLLFRCFFRIAKFTVRYVDLSPQGALRGEMELKDSSRQLLEMRQYYPSGQLRTSCDYTCQTPAPAVDGGRAPEKRLPWFARHAVLLRHGRDIRYHPNGRRALELEYLEGQPKDGVYSDWDQDGALKATYEFRGGTLVSVKRMQPVQTAGRKAFLFGQDIYQQTAQGDDRSWIRNLDGCYNDIVRLRDALVQSEGFDPKNVVMTGGEEATRRNMLHAFDRFVAGLVKGDKVFLHFSSMGILNRDSDSHSLRYYIPCRDIWKYTQAKPDSGALSQGELQDFLSRVQRKVGRRGQVLLSLDACHAGVFLSDSLSTTTPAVSLNLRGEQHNFLFDFIQREEAPSAILSATTREGLGYEMRGQDGKPYGVYSYFLAEALKDPTLSNLEDLFRFVSDNVQQYRSMQQPGFLARGPMQLFEESRQAEEAIVSLPALRPSGNTFNLSVGISQYPRAGKDRLTFANARSDAESYDRYFREQFAHLSTDSVARPRTVLLQDAQATKEEIICYINEAISNTRPNDYFVFNFSGYCRQLTDSSGKKQTWFVPYGLTNIGSDAEIREKGISLTQLKELLQLIPANNQLFISEAGATPDFQREFIQALIETSPTIASLSRKNRVFLVPKTSGADNCPCKGAVLEKGPLNHYITSLPEGLNIYGLFADSLNTEAIRFALAKAEVDCDYFRTGYFDIFFERDFIRQMKLFLPEEIMQSRGIGIVEKERKEIVSRISRRVALIVGTNEYGAATQWPRLANPVPDAKAMADVLSRNFGFETMLLLDKPSDSIYQQLLVLAQTLQPSDQLLIYMGGHGDFDARLFDDGFIVTSDSRPVAEDPFRNSYLQYSKLSRLINKLPPMQILTILDVCFGGTFDERVARNKERGAYEDLSNAAFLQDKLKKRTRLYLTSGSKNVVPDGYAGRHSPFALRLLEAFETRGGTERMLTASALYQFVQKLPSKPLLGSFGDDEVGSEFVLVGR